MKPIRPLLIALAVAAFVGAAWPTLAAPVVTFRFEGMVTELGANQGLFGAPGAVTLGDSFSGQFSYDRGPGNPDQVPGDPEVGGYLLSSFSIDQSVVPLTVLATSVRHQAPGVTLPPAPPDVGSDAYSARATTPVYPAGVLLLLDAPFGAVFSDDSLPADLSLAAFSSGLVGGIVAVGLFPAPSIQDLGVLTLLEAVPEPSALALLALGGAALRAARRRRR